MKTHPVIRTKKAKLKKSKYRTDEDTTLRMSTGEKMIDRRAKPKTNRRSSELGSEHK